MLATSTSTMPRTLLLLHQRPLAVSIGIFFFCIFFLLTYICLGLSTTTTNDGRRRVTTEGRMTSNGPWEVCFLFCFLVLFLLTYICTIGLSTTNNERRCITMEGKDDTGRQWAWTARRSSPLAGMFFLCFFSLFLLTYICIDLSTTKYERCHHDAASWRRGRIWAQTTHCIVWARMYFFFRFFFVFTNIYV
jgi:hypothetical protein